MLPARATAMLSARATSMLLARATACTAVSWPLPTMLPTLPPRILYPPSAVARSSSVPSLTMWRRCLFVGAAANRRSSRSLSTAAATSAINSLILRSLKEHYLELSKMSPPPKVNPPAPYTIIKGALDRDGPVLQREYKGEEINISVMRLSNILPAGAEDEDSDSNDVISQLFLHVDVSKPGRKDGLHFLCRLYLDAIRIHSVCRRLKDENLRSRSLIKYQGRVFQ